MSKEKVLVAMSGGVDSSLTAALLQRQGYEVIGVTMRLKDELSADVDDAATVADKLGINFHVVDLREDFQKDVVKYFVEEYLNGRTPNPCVRCNKKIKFGKLFEVAENLGANFLATGHYARIIFEDGRFKLKKAVDVRKDQSYVLYNLRAEQLEKILFPLGDFSKVDTRAMAQEFNLPVAQKKDSQEICFVPNDDYKNFLQKLSPNADAFQAGEIVDTSGKILGRHNGVANYTIGQRKGLGIAAENPLYVVRIDAPNRRVIVGKNDEVFAKSLIAKNVHWIYPPNLSKSFDAKIRYGLRIARCKIFAEENFLRVTFDEPQRAITAGQSIVFYDGDEVLGGGIIEGVMADGDA
ncbi:MAG: tRNA 2-thiouridine(34) synthase MnmA [Selenomonadaceae bacterium]|nr:tRNA 2-thiouridine(34) synthase MnmA [Selenomonadaceae bacterium]